MRTAARVRQPGPGRFHAPPGLRPPRAHFTQYTRVCQLAAVILSTTTLQSCDVTQEEARAVQSPQRGAEFIRGERLITYPQTIAVVGDYLAVGDLADTMLRIFDRKTGRPTGTVGRKGGGPGEFQSIWTIQAVSTSDGQLAAWVYDSQLGRLSGYRIDAAGRPSAITTSIVARIPGRPLSMQWLDAKTIVAVGFFDSGRFLLVGMDGYAIRSLGAIPLAGDRFPPFAAQQALQPSLSIQPNGRLIAIAARYAARVDIYDTRDGSLVPARVPIPFEPVVNVATRGRMPVFISDQETRFGYLWITATRERIFALFSGRTRAEYPGHANFGEQVHVFDWSGGFLGVLDLERDIIVIAVDSDGSTLYALGYEPEPIIFSYPVTSLLSPSDPSGAQ